MDPSSVNGLAGHLSTPVEALGLALLAALAGLIALVLANRRLAGMKLERERYGRVVEGAREGIWDWNVATGEVYFSPRLAELAGLALHEIGADFSALKTHCHPDDLKGLLRAARKHLRRNTPLDIEFRLLQRDGRYRWYRSVGRATFGRDGAPTHVSGSFAEITSRRKIEATLHHLADARHVERGGLFWRSLAAHLSANLEMEYVCVNLIEEGGEQATTLAVFNSGVFEENSTYQLKDTPCGQVAEKGVCCFPTGVADLFPGDEELKKLKAESYLGTLLWDGGGKPVGLIAVVGSRPLEDARTALAVLDIAGVRAAQELEKMKREREREDFERRLAQTQKLEAVGRLAGGVAHEFNNMLGVILGHAQLALETAGPESPLTEDLEQIEFAARRSAETAARLLTFARRQVVTPLTVDLNQEIEKALPMLRELVGEEIEVAFTPDPSLWRVRADATQLQLILANLATNARDAIKAVGGISIATANVVLGEGEEAPAGCYASFTFTDNGQGIPDEFLPNIFEPFFTTKAVGEGSGLGLSTVHGIVAQHGGFIRVFSTAGAGTSLTLFIPRVAGASEAALGSGAKSGGTILIVEDEKAILNLARKVLAARGYRVLTAPGPADALAFAAHPPEGGIDLLLTDVVMPQMDGRTLCGEFRRFHPQLRCLYMSGYAADVVELRGILEGEVDFIAKPFEIEALCDKVAEVLARAA